MGGFTPPLNTRIFCSKLCTIDLGGSPRLLDSLCTAYMCCNEKALDLSILCKLKDARGLSERTVRIIQDDSGACWGCRQTRQPVGAVSFLASWAVTGSLVPRAWKEEANFLTERKIERWIPSLNECHLQCSNLALCPHVGSRKNHQRELLPGHLPMQHEFSMNWLHQK